MSRRIGRRVKQRVHLQSLFFLHVLLVLTHENKTDKMIRDLGKY